MADSKDLHSAEREHYEKSTQAEAGRRRSSIADLNRGNNLDAKISNPLAGIPYQDLLADVEAFARDNGLESETELLKKGALVARNPSGFESLPELDEDEKDALRTEVTKKWAHPLKLYLTVAVCSLGAAVQGWDQTGTNGANLSFPDAFGLASGSSRDYWIIGLVNSGPYIGSAFLGCWISDPCNRYFGRRGTIFISAIILIATPIGGAVCRTWEELFATRFLMGIGMGLKGATTPVFAAENAPAAIRGALVMTWQFWTAFGIFLGTAFNLAVWNTPDSLGWRLQLGSAFIPAVPLAALVYLCPESPRWYIKHKKIGKAYQSLLKLRRHRLLAARDLYYIATQIEIEHSIVGDSSYVTRFFQLFTIPRVRRATLASWVVMISQQMCGINIMAFYSSTIFAESGASNFQALLGSFGFGAVNFVFAIPAFFTIDTFGRRSLLLFTFPNMAWTLLAAGFSFYIPEGNSARLGVIALFVYMFAAFYSPGEGPVPFTYSAEVFPLSHREVGMGWAVATCLFWAAVLGLVFPLLLADIGATGAFAFFAGLNIVALIWIFLWLPETKQRTLEELDYIFAVPTRKFVKYQCGTWLPWFIKRYIFFNKNATLKPLYTFEQGTYEDLRDQRKQSVAGGDADGTTSSEEDQRR